MLPSFKKNKERGIIIYLTVVMMAVLMSMALGVGAILFEQTKSTKELGDSVFAFYAANSGMEEMLEWIYVQDKDPDDFVGCDDFENACDLDNIKHPITREAAKYYFEVLGGGVSNCIANNFCVKSIGIYGNVKRAIEVRY